MSGKRNATREIQVGSGIRPVTALSRRYYTKSFREVEGKLTRADSRMVAVMGRIRTEDGITADGVTLRDQGLTLVQADSNSRTFTQLGKHEVMHNYVNADAKIRQQVWQQVMSVLDGIFTESEVDTKVQTAYVNSHGKAYGDFEKNKWAYREEFLADLYGGLNDRAGIDPDLFDILSRAVGKAQATGYPPEKWSTDPPEGAAVPESWVMKAAEDAADYGIPVSSYVTVYAATKDLESIKDGDGETVDNSLSLQTAAVIHGLGLSKARTDKLLEDFNVNKTVRGYSGAMVNRKLSAMKQKYQ